MLFRPLRHIADKFNTLQMGMVAADRIFKILRTESQIEDLGTLNPDKIHGGISIKNLTFSYVTGEKVLHGINLEIKPGEKIAVVGATGAGKSTIINLLSRFYEFDEGLILLDKNSIKDFSLNGLRKHIGIVLQDVFLFADTIYNNITLYDTDIDEEDVYYAAKEIGVHDFILSLPGGYQYNVKERGVMLSSGQRQLISFLRVYLSNPSILILDEATSSIDSYAEEMIKIATRKITKGKTSILIAHRLSTIKNTDRIVVMEKGNIVEIGSHKELLANTGGHYSQLHKIQFLASVV
jgi:subfamily B ATP-binding cassette protein MsbA